MLASLNHPNIAQIYGLEEGPPEAGHHARALVIELVEGETLAERLSQTTRHKAHGTSRKGLPIDEAVAIARQIGAALEAAHEKGIVHRDLKPSNVALTRDGQINVLDFGLAKLNDSNAPDVPTALNAGGRSPRWSSDGRELFYRNGRQTMAVAVKPGPTLGIAAPRLLLEGNYVEEQPGQGAHNYDVSGDGRRFLMMAPTAENERADERAWAAARNIAVLGEHLMIEGVPVQPLLAYNPLVEEAIDSARVHDYEGVPVRVVDPEHLIALALQAGGARRRERAWQLLQSGDVDRRRLRAILDQHGVPANMPDDV